jgi:hypothetical protein
VRSRSRETAFRRSSISGGYVYVANESAGIQMIDVANPAGPVRVGGYDTSGCAFGVALSRNHAYVADGDGGLVILRVGAVGDFDLDGDVDLDDFLAFQACFNGPNRPFAQAECGGADFDHDVDADLADFLTFQGCFNGPNRPPSCL